MKKDVLLNFDLESKKKGRPTKTTVPKGSIFEKIGISSEF